MYPEHLERRYLKYLIFRYLVPCLGGGTGRPGTWGVSGRHVTCLGRMYGDPLPGFPRPLLPPAALAGLFSSLFFSLLPRALPSSLLATFGNPSLGDRKLPPSKDPAAEQLPRPARG